MKTKEEIFELAKEVLAKELNVDEVELSSDWVDDLGLDSLELVETLMWLENRLSVSVTDERAADIKTIENLVDAVYDAQ